MKKIFSVFSLILISLVFTACGWIWNLGAQYVYIDQETKDYCLFGQGTYWVYQDSATLEYDNVLINRVDKAWLKYNAENTGGYEDYEIYASMRQDVSAEPQTYIMALTTFHEDYDAVQKPNWLHTNRNDEYGVIYHNCGIGEMYYGAELIEIIDTMQIADSIFFAVKQFTDTTSTNFKTWYFAKNVGLIRMEMQNEERKIVKNLVRYDVKLYP
jgi:hypothetical protein